MYIKMKSFLFLIVRQREVLGVRLEQSTYMKTGAHPMKWFLCPSVNAKKVSTQMFMI